MKVFLHVEDDEFVARAVARFLRRTYPGSFVSTVATVEDAIVVLKSIQQDLVLCDFNLKGNSTGDQLLAWVSVNQPHLVDRFVYLSDDKRCSAHKHWITKPATTQTIAVVLDKVLAS